VANPLGISVEGAALEIKSRIDEAMGKVLRRIREKITGEDDPLLVVYGGAGPDHCCHMAKTAGLERIVVTPFSAVFSAFSSSNMDVGHRYDSRVDLPLDQSSDFGALDEAIAAIKRKALRDMRGEGFSVDQIEWALELFVQAGEAGPEVRFGAEIDFYRDPNKIEEVIRTARELTNGDGTSGLGNLVLRMVCLIARAEVAHFEMREVPPASVGVEQTQKGSRRLFLDRQGGGEPTPVYDRSLLTNGHNLLGPALIESEQTTLLVPAGWRMRVDRYNNAILEEVRG
jgi:N-methylhydantoinase A/acetophenone carboxylase